MMLLLAADRGFDGLGWLPGKLHAERFPWAKAEGLAAFYDIIVPKTVAKLGNAWGATLDEAQFTTYSHHYKVGKIAGETAWRVGKNNSSIVFDEEFANFAEAEAFRLTKESRMPETVPMIYLSDSMRVDIRRHGLPRLGMIGKRLPLPNV